MTHEKNIIRWMKRLTRLNYNPVRRTEFISCRGPIPFNVSFDGRDYNKYHISVSVQMGWANEYEVSDMMGDVSIMHGCETMSFRHETRGWFVVLEYTHELNYPNHTISNDDKIRATLIDLENAVDMLQTAHAWATYVEQEPAHDWAKEGF